MENPSAKLLGLAVLALIMVAGLAQAVATQQAPRISRSLVIVFPRPLEGRAEFDLSTDAVSIHVLVEDGKAYVEASVELAGNTSLAMVVLSREMDGAESVPSLVVDLPPLSLDEILAKVVSRLAAEGFLEEADLAAGVKVYNDTVTISYDGSTLTFLINPELGWTPLQPLSIQAITEEALTTTITPTQTAATRTYTGGTANATTTPQAVEQQVQDEATGTLGNLSAQGAHLIKISFATTRPSRVEEAGAGAVIAALMVGLLVALLSYIVVRMRL